MRKKFDKELHNKYDTLARDKAKEVFANLAPYSIVESEKKTAVDFQILKDGVHVGYLEVEVKKTWDGAVFKYADVQFPERKWKYCKLDKPTIFMMFNSDLSNYLNVTGEELLSSKLEMVRNKYIKYGEMFFKVPVAKITFDNVQALLDNLGETK